MEADGGQEYSSEIEKLHREQYDSLPEDERYTGMESVEGLLEKKTSGEILDEQEDSPIVHQKTVPPAHPPPYPFLPQKVPR